MKEKLSRIQQLKVTGIVTEEEHPAKIPRAILYDFLKKPTLANLIKFRKEAEVGIDYRPCTLVRHPFKPACDCKRCPLELHSEGESDIDYCTAVCSDEWSMKRLMQFWKSNKGMFVINYTRFMAYLEEYEEEHGNDDRIS